MSHFTTIQTKLVEKEFLKKALTDLELAYQEGEVDIRGYNGQTARVEIKVPTKNPGYDMGFRKQGGAYDLVADWYGIKDVNQEQLVQNLNQRYAYHAAREQLEQQDFTIVEEEVLADRTIHITVRRMV